MIKTGQALGDVLAQAAAQLQEAGIPEPAREALRLWGGLTGHSCSEGVLRKSFPLPEPEEGRLVEAARRRAAGEPLAYVTGWTGDRKSTRLNSSHRL